MFQIRLRSIGKLMLIAVISGVILGFAICGSDFPSAIAVQSSRFLGGLQSRFFNGSQTEEAVNARLLDVSEKEIHQKIVVFLGKSRELADEENQINELTCELENLMEKFSRLDDFLENKKSDDILRIGGREFSRESIISEKNAIDAVINSKERSLDALAKSSQIRRDYLNVLKMGIDSAIAQLSNARTTQSEWKAALDTTAEAVPEVSSTLEKVISKQKTALMRVNDARVATEMIRSGSKTVLTPICDELLASDIKSQPKCSSSSSSSRRR
ncbi:MAG: hypothetical protein LBT05_14455 [Planctomycetaceae bacterium]|jgi:chromosome segregation ATPase|nr:hypothetical protein [Planctomycetaceae bacterium]